jgi:hypothetical protein
MLHQKCKLAPGIMGEIGFMKLVTLSRDQIVVREINICWENGNPKDAPELKALVMRRAENIPSTANERLSANLF